MQSTIATHSLARSEIISPAPSRLSSKDEHDPIRPLPTPKQWNQLPWQILLSLLAVGVTTAGIYGFNRTISHMEPGIYVRPNLAPYLLPILLMTWLGRRNLGIFTLLACDLAAAYYIFPPFGWRVTHPPDWISLVTFTLTNGLIVFGMDALQQKNALIAETLGARQESARRVQETIAVQARLQSVVEAAREQSQGAILPHLLLPELPERVPGLDLRVHFEALLNSTDVSTPFFDSFLVQEDQTAIVVGTVANSGPAATATVAMMRYLLRSALYRCATVADAVTELNEMLISHRMVAGPSRLFVGLYQASSQTLISLSCGAATALVRRAETGQVEELTEAGPLLGPAAGAIYRQQAIHLDAGDVILLSPGGGAAPEVQADAAHWRKALASSSPATDAEQWIRHLVQARQKASPANQNSSVCLLAAQVTDDGAEDSARTQDDF